VLALYLVWKVYSATSRNPKVNYRGWKLFLRASEIDIWSGIRPGVLLTEEQQAEKRAEQQKMTTMDKILYVPKSFVYSLFI